MKDSDREPDDNKDIDLIKKVKIRATLRASVVMWVILLVAVIISSALYGLLTINGLPDNTSFLWASFALIALLIVGITLAPKSLLKRLV